MKNNDFLMLAANMIFHDIVFESGKVYAYITSDKENLTTIREEILRLYTETSIPKIYLPKLITKNKNILEFDNYQKVLLIKATPCSLRGWSINTLYLDGIVDNDEEINRSIIPCVAATSGKIFRNG